jgi:membrane associated rhomboid family serine protease
MSAPATIIILIVTSLATFYAFRRPHWEERWVFDTQAILVRKEYFRLLTSGFIHLNWFHFALNAFSFYFFARVLELGYGAGTLLAIYGSSIVGGSLLSLFVHRHHEYRALGASGGVSGIIFASIFLLPGMGITLFPLPINIPGYIYAPLFLVASFFAHRHNLGNIGHDAHLGGAIIGLLVAAAMYPQMILAAPGTFAVVVIVSIIVLVILIRDPLSLVTWLFGDEREPAAGERARRYRENAERNKKLARLDQLLDQVSRKGVESLAPAQRKELEQLSRELYGRGRPDQ